MAKLRRQHAQRVGHDLAKNRGTLASTRNEDLERCRFVEFGEWKRAEPCDRLPDWVADKLDLAPKDERLRQWTHQIQLTIADFVLEGHDVHHPIGAGQYYEDQKPESLRRAKEFREERVPKFLGWFETILEKNPEGPAHLVGDRLTYADLSIFQAMSGLTYAFPKLMNRLGPNYGKVNAVCADVAELPNIAAYLASERRIAPNENDLFRHYPELDA